MRDIRLQIHKNLIKKGKTLGIAESCTGGLLSEMLTRLPGSSQYFLLAVVVYSNRSKIRILKIPANIIAKYGAVSKETARLMAQNIRKLCSSDLGIGITGIAGPTGATQGKPVGTVFIAIENDNKGICRKFNFTGSRTQIRQKAALKALYLLKILL